MDQVNSVEPAIPALGDIEFGRPDANAEHDTAIKNNKAPLYRSCFVHPPISFQKDFNQGTRFFIVGQKGVGKTAFLRVLHDETKKKGSKAEYVVFNDQIAQDESIYSPEDILVKREDISQTTYHLHSIKRILMAILIKMIEDDRSATEHLRETYGKEGVSLIGRIRNSSAADLVRNVCDEIASIVQSASIDVNVTGRLGKVRLNPEQLIKKRNDTLLKELIQSLAQTSRAGKKFAIFIDEIQYNYSDEDAYREGATLVRDMIVAALNLNRSFMNNRVDATIYIAIRSEFLSHPIIAKANVAQSIESYGEKLFWRANQRNENDPLLSIITRRVRATVKKKFENSDLFKYYLANISPKEFLSYTWRKPRDVIRFFSKARELFPEVVILDRGQLMDVLRQYSLDCWEDMKPAAATLLNEAGLQQLHGLMEENAGFFGDPSYGMPAGHFMEKLKPIYATLEKEIKKHYTLESLFQFLFSIGIFYSFIEEGGKKRVSFACLGHQAPYYNGKIRLHRTLALAFSK